jgi:hypothetical protein
MDVKMLLLPTARWYGQVSVGAQRHVTVFETWCEGGVLFFARSASHRVAILDSECITDKLIVQVAANTVTSLLPIPACLLQ